MTGTYPGPGEQIARHLHLLRQGLQPCMAGQCERYVGSGVAYCCAPCREAWEATPRYEPHAHSDWCEQRWAERTAGVRR